MLASSESLLWHVLRASECVFSSVSAQYSLPNWICHPPLQPPLTPATIAATTNKHTRNIQEMNGNRTENISITDGESPWCQSSSSLSWICFTIVYGNKKNRWARPQVWNRTKWSTNALITIVLSVKNQKKKKKNNAIRMQKTQKRYREDEAVYIRHRCVYTGVYGPTVYIGPIRKRTTWKWKHFFHRTLWNIANAQARKFFNSDQKSKIKFYHVTWCVDFHKLYMQFLISDPF